jgi:hypothetical protein
MNNKGDNYQLGACSSFIDWSKHEFQKSDSVHVRQYHLSVQVESL